MLTWRFRQIPLAPEPVIKPTGRATSNSGSSNSMMVRAPIPAEMLENVLDPPCPIPDDWNTIA